MRSQILSRTHLKSMVANVVAASFLAASVGCSHAVTIDSEPSGAEITVNGAKIGTGPVTYDETTGWDKAYTIELKKNGFPDKSVEVKQSEFNTPILGGSIGGAVLLFISGFGTIVSFVPLIGIAFSKQLPEDVVIPLGGDKAGASGSDTGGESTYDYGY